MTDSVISSIWWETELKTLCLLGCGTVELSPVTVAVTRTFGTIIHYRRQSVTIAHPSVTIPKDEDIVIEFNPF